MVGKHLFERMVHLNIVCCAVESKSCILTANLLKAEQNLRIRRYRILFRAQRLGRVKEVSVVDFGASPNLLCNIIDPLVVSLHILDAVHVFTSGTCRLNVTKRLVVGDNDVHDDVLVVGNHFTAAV